MKARIVNVLGWGCVSAAVLACVAVGGGPGPDDERGARWGLAAEWAEPVVPMVCSGSCGHLTAPADLAYLRRARGEARPGAAAPDGRP